MNLPRSAFNRRYNPVTVLIKFPPRRRAGAFLWTSKFYYILWEIRVTFAGTTQIDDDLLESFQNFPTDIYERGSAVLYTTRVPYMRSLFAV